jgi:serine/threonine-protein kinase
MAPEQLLGRTQDIDARTDVFGLGGVLYEILTGAPPNEGNGVMAAVRGEPPRGFSPRKLWAELPPELCRITAKALATTRDARYPSMAALRADLEQFLKGGGWFDTLSVKAGQSIVTEGEPGSTAYVIQSGTCEVWKNMLGERQLLRRLGPGDVFGEAAVFGGGTRTASIVAADDVTLRCVTGEALNRELDQNPMLAAFVRSLAALFRETDAALSARSMPPPDTD